jgi:hypothetical protein
MELRSCAAGSAHEAHRLIEEATRMNPRRRVSPA